MESGEYYAIYLQLKLAEPFIVITFLTIITIASVICCIRLGKLCKNSN